MDAEIVCTTNNVSLIETDTDGIYTEHPTDPQALTAEINEVIRSRFPQSPWNRVIEVTLEEYDAILMYEAKNYVLKRGADLLFHGAGFKGRHMPPLCEAAIKEIAKAIFEGATVSLVRAQHLSRLHTHPLTAYAMSIELSKDEYVDTTMHNALAEKMRGGGYVVEAGMEITYVKTYSEYIPLGLEDDEVVRKQLDMKYYRKRLIDVMDRICEPITSQTQQVLNIEK